MAKKGKYVSSKTGVQMTYRSSWELRYFSYLDKNPDVVTYYSEFLKIPYVSSVRSGKVKNYVPDVYVEYIDGSRKVIEIKPSSKLDMSVNVKKFNAARDWCNSNEIEFEIVTEHELKALGLL